MQIFNFIEFICCNELWPITNWEIKIVWSKHAIYCMSTLNMCFTLHCRWMKFKSFNLRPFLFNFFSLVRCVFYDDKLLIAFSFLKFETLLILCLIEISCFVIFLYFENIPNKPHLKYYYLFIFWKYLYHTESVYSYFTLQSCMIFMLSRVIYCTLSYFK